MNKYLIFFSLLILSFGNSIALEHHDKWIVITTIQYPTKALKKVASLPGWHVVVVGDKKTPNDWYCENCDYLSIEKQLELGYKCADILPCNHYCRKNIGFLYAISKGAKIIYETDDDNEVLDSIIEFSDLENIVELNAVRNIVNVYAYFGQPGVWPRGYPLSEIVHSNDFYVKPLQTKSKIAVIQSLVDKDPDVDAIFRLTRGTEIFFDLQNPCVLPSKLFCPFNTQNTVFDYNAFWGLYIPASTPFRVCDIWRSYMVQRMLWDLDMVVCFTSPTAVQERNVHDFFKDFCGEQELYLDAGHLLNFLLTWEDAEAFTIQEHYVNLMKALANEEYVQQKEVDYLQAWLHDLKKVGYKFPDYN